MTMDKIALAELLEKGPDADLVREMLGFMAQRLMELQAEALCGAESGERSPDRVNQRNGYRERPWDTRVGPIGLRIPKLRKESYFPPFREPRRTGEKALAAVRRSSTRMTCQPYSVCTGVFEVSPFFIAKAASANGGSILSLAK